MFMNLITAACGFVLSLGKLNESITVVTSRLRSKPLDGRYRLWVLKKSRRLAG